MGSPTITVLYAPGAPPEAIEVTDRAAAGIRSLLGGVDVVVTTGPDGDADEPTDETPAPGLPE